MESVTVYAFDPRTIAPASLNVVFGHSSSATTNLVNWLVATMPCEFQCGFCISSTGLYDKMFPPAFHSSDLSGWNRFASHMERHPYPCLTIVDHSWSSVASRGLYRDFLDEEVANKRQMARIIVAGHPWGNEAVCEPSVNRLKCADYIFVFANRNPNHREILWKVVKQGFDSYRNFARYWDRLATHRRAMVINAKAIRGGCRDVTKFLFHCEPASTPSPKFGQGEWWKTGLLPITPLPRFEPGSIESFGSKRILTSVENGDSTKTLVSGLLDYLAANKHVEWVNSVSEHDLGLDESCAFRTVKEWNTELLRTMISTMKSRGNNLMDKACIVFDYGQLVPAWSELRSFLKGGEGQYPLFILLDAPFEVPLNSNEIGIVDPKTVNLTTSRLYHSLRVSCPFFDFERYLERAKHTGDLLVAHRGILYSGGHSLRGKPTNPSLLTKTLMTDFYVKEKEIVNEIARSKANPVTKPKEPAAKPEVPPVAKLSNVEVDAKARVKTKAQVGTQPGVVGAGFKTSNDHDPEDTFPSPAKLTRQTAALSFNSQKPPDSSRRPKPSKLLTSGMSHLPAKSLIPSSTAVSPVKGSQGSLVQSSPAKRPKRPEEVPLKKNNKPVLAEPRTKIVGPNVKAESKQKKPKVEAEPKTEASESKPSKPEISDKDSLGRAPSLHGLQPSTSTEVVPPSSWWKGLW